MSMMVTCEEADQFLDEYLSEELPRRQRAIVELHIRICPACRRYLDQYRQSVDLCRRSFHGSEEEEDEELAQRLLRGILEVRKKTRSQRRG